MYKRQGPHRARPCDVGHEGVQRGRGRDEHAVALEPAEHQVGGELGQPQPADQGAVGVVAEHRLAGRGPDPTGVVEPQAVEVVALDALGEHLAAAQRAVVAHLEHPQVPGSGVGDVEPPLVQREGQAVGPDEVVGHDAHLAGRRVDPVDVAAVDLLLGGDALVVADDPVRRVGEPDGAVGADHHVVGAVEPPALPAVGDDRDGAVVLGAGDAPVALLAGDHPAFAVERVAVGVAGRLPERAHGAGHLVPAQHPLVGDVAPDQEAAGREVDRALRPAGAGVEDLDLVVSADAGESLVQHLELSGDRVRHTEHHTTFGFAGESPDSILLWMTSTEC